LANGNGQYVAALQVLEEGNAHQMGVDVDSHRGSPGHGVLEGSFAASMVLMIP
jgi:hypothetical protein